MSGLVLSVLGFLIMFISINKIKVLSPRPDLFCLSNPSWHSSPRFKFQPQLLLFISQISPQHEEITLQRSSCSCKQRTHLSLQPSPRSSLGRPLNSLAFFTLHNWGYSYSTKMLVYLPLLQHGPIEISVLSFSGPSSAPIVAPTAARQQKDAPDSQNNKLAGLAPPPPPRRHLFFQLMKLHSRG